MIFFGGLGWVFLGKEGEVGFEKLMMRGECGLRVQAGENGGIDSRVEGWRGGRRECVYADILRGGGEIAAECEREAEGGVAGAARDKKKRGEKRRGGALLANWQQSILGKFSRLKNYS